MTWLGGLRANVRGRLFPSSAQIAELEVIKSDVEETRGFKQRAQDSLAVAMTQAATLRQMDRDNHYSESLTKAIRGRQF